MIVDFEESKAKTEPDFSLFIGESSAMMEVYTTITRLLDNDSTVLVTGESGTGKELIAKSIHMNSDRRDNPMITVNCGAIPEDLLESELFGHEKGAFTGAIRTRQGKFELADKGTIFLDEIGEMSPALQVKLLRVLQEREFERVGGAKTISVDVRVITATNQDLEKAISEGRFREDLFYRLNVIPIEVPPLRDRGDDVALLIGHFLKKFNRKMGRQVRGVTPEALGIMKSYNWPGNVRELEHMMERLVVLKNDEGFIERADLPPKLREVEIEEDPQLLKDMLLVGDPDELEESGVDTQAIDLQRDKAQTRAAAGNGDESSGDCEKTESDLEADIWRKLDIAPPILPEGGINLKEAVDKYETALILAALERSNWVKNKAAALLELNRTTLVEKLKKKKLLNGPEKEESAA